LFIDISSFDIGCSAWFLHCFLGDIRNSKYDGRIEKRPHMQVYSKDIAVVYWQEAKKGVQF
jgi:hypothetical protein